MSRADIDIATSPVDASIVTCSFRGDFDVCAMLCESIDRFVPDTVRHLLYVPESDLELFRPLANPRRTIASQESLLPGWMWKLPLPGPQWRRRLLLPRRNFYLTPFSLPVRGWIAQQLMKIAASAASPTELVLHIDSDVLFIRPFSVERILQPDGRARLFRRPSEDLASHRSWHLAASRLLGLPPDEFHDGDYIDAVAVWRRSVVRELIRRIAQVGRRDWRIVLARTPHFSEYLLYGVFAERVIGLGQAKLGIEEFSLCHTRWQDGFAGEADKAEFIAAIDPRAVTSCIQSTIPLPAAERRELHERMISFARSQDATAARPADAGRQAGAVDSAS